MGHSFKGLRARERTGEVVNVMKLLFSQRILKDITLEDFRKKMEYQKKRLGKNNFSFYV